MWTLYLFMSGFFFALVATDYQAHRTIASRSLAAKAAATIAFAIAFQLAYP